MSDELQTEYGSTSDLTLPIIHRNGTNREDLRVDYTRIANATRELEIAISEATFHPRDYYLVEGAWEKALEERERWVRAPIRKLRRYLYKIRKHIDRAPLRVERDVEETVPE